MGLPLQAALEEAKKKQSKSPANDYLKQVLKKSRKIVHGKAAKLPKKSPPSAPSTSGFSGAMFTGYDGETDFDTFHPAVFGDSSSKKHGFKKSRSSKGKPYKKQKYTQKEKYLYNKRKALSGQKWTSAGGIVTPSKDDLTKVLVIKPSNNYGPWSFPKGQVDKGETKQIAAIREVEEETGVKARILSGTSYVGSGKGGHSVTHYFLMHRVSGKPHGSDETEKAIFVPWDQAINLFVRSGNRRDPKLALKAMKMLGVLK